MVEPIEYLADLIVGVIPRKLTIRWKTLRRSCLQRGRSVGALWTSTIEDTSSTQRAICPMRLAISGTKALFISSLR